jgi:hypothetical protein
MMTTWPAFTEAMYLLGSAGGWTAQDTLWHIVQREDLRIVELGAEERARTRALMERYHDTPMDLADASLVAVAESLNLRRVFTLDKDFHVYRFRGRHPFEIVP